LKRQELFQIFLKIFFDSFFVFAICMENILDFIGKSCYNHCYSFDIPMR